MFTRSVSLGVVLVGSLLIAALAAQSPVAGPHAVQGRPLAVSPCEEGGLHGTAEFAGAGAYMWVAPEGVCGVLVELWGAGGGGSRPYGYQSAGDGGGAGAFVRSVVAVEPGQTYIVTVGAAGFGATPPLPFGSPGSRGEPTTFATSLRTVLTHAGGGAGGNDVDDGQGGIADTSAQIHRDGRGGGHGFGITPGQGGTALTGSLEPPYALGGGSGGVGQINASGMNGSPGYAILLW